MRKFITGTATIVFLIGGCGSDNTGSSGGAANNSQPTAERGGTITVGGETWTFVPSTQCSVYPGNVVSIAGHAAENPDLEIIIDWGGPNQARIAESDSGPGWHAVRDTLDVQINGKNVTGSATFSEYFSGTGERAEGSFDIQC
jgi:hypothetical protein